MSQGEGIVKAEKKRVRRRVRRDIGVDLRLRVKGKTREELLSFLVKGRAGSEGSP